MKFVSYLILEKSVVEFLGSLILILTLLLHVSTEQQKVRIECNKPDRKLKHQIFTLNKTERSLNLQNSTHFNKQCEFKYTGSRFLRSYNLKDQLFLVSTSQVFYKSKKIKYDLNNPQSANEYDNLLSYESHPNPLDPHNSYDSPFHFLSVNISDLKPSLISTSFLPTPDSSNISSTTTTTTATTTTTTTTTTTLPLSTTPIQSDYANIDSFFADILTSIDLEIHVFDFYLISGDIYINFNILANEKEKVANAQRVKNKRLIINLVARQFVTFRLINFHLAHQVYEEVLILLAGQSNLHVRDKTHESIIRVFNAPIYTDRQKWFPYLIQMFGNQKSEYYEHLNKFCQISHLKIDIVQPIIVPAKSDQMTSDENELESDTYIADLIVDFYELVEFDYSKMDSDVTLLKSCVIEHHEYDSLDYNDTYSFTEEEFYKISLGNIYLFEVEQKGNNNNVLRLFVKDCLTKDQYFLIFYVFNYNRNQSQAKKIVLDDSNCKLFVLSNAQVVDVYDNKYHNYKYFDGFDIDAHHPNASSLLRKSIGHLVYVEFEAKLFFYLKLKSDADEVEFHFLEPYMDSAQDMVSNKFSNRVNHQMFSELYRNEPSIRFVISKNDLLDYFHRSNLNLTGFLQFHNQNELDEHRKRLYQFYVGSEQCPALFLNTNLTDFGDDMYILLFNSNNYKQTTAQSDHPKSNIRTNLLNNQDNCFYFDGQIVYSLFFFHLDHGEFKESIFFSLNQPVNRIKFNNEHHVEVVENYLNQLINFVLNSNYYSEVSENTKDLLAKTNTNTTQTIDLNVHIELNLVDYFFNWELNACWLSDNECSNLMEKNKDDENEDISEDDTMKRKHMVKRQSGLDQIQRINVNSDPNLDYDYDKMEPNEITNELVMNRSNTSLNQLSLRQIEMLNIDWRLASSHIDNNHAFNADGLLKLIDFSNANKKKYLLCSIKPVLNCISNEKCHSNLHLKDYNRTFVTRNTPMKTIKLIRFDYEANQVDLKHAINPCTNQFRPSSNFKPNNRATDSNESEEVSETVFWNDVHIWLINNKITLILISLLIVLLVFTVVLICILTQNNCINIELANSETANRHKYGVDLNSSDNHELQVKLLNQRNANRTNNRESLGNAQATIDQRQCSTV